MKDLHFILLLLRKEFLLEFRTRSAISGIFLYVISTLFVVYETFVKIQPNVWNTLFWIILLFVAVNAMVKSFVQEKGNRVLYYYSLLNPSHVLIAKIVYNTLLLLVLSLLIWGLFIFFGDNPVKDMGLFLLILFLGSFGFSVTFTFLASLVAASNQSSTLLAVLSLLIWGLFIFFGDNPVKDMGLFLLILFLGSFGFSVTFTFLASLVAASNQSSTLLAVLSFPLIIPIILMLVKISAHALRLIQDTAVSGDLAILVAIDLLLCGVALLLFPFIWRD